jgi:hypothetical protein
LEVTGFHSKETQEDSVKHNKAHASRLWAVLHGDPLPVQISFLPEQPSCAAPPGSVKPTTVAVAHAVELRVWPGAHWPQLPSELQLVHAEGIHLVPAHLPSLHVPEAHADEESHVVPSDFFAAMHWYELKVYPDVHRSQSPSESQLVHAEGLHLAPAHRPSLQAPDAQEEDAEQVAPSDFLVEHLPELSK